MDRQIHLRYKSQIVVLSIVALVFKALSSISYFATYEGGWKDGYELSFQFPNIIQLFYLVLGVLPYILLVIYVQKFHKEFKATVVVPVIFASIAIVPLLSLIINIINGHGFSGIIVYLITPITFALATISALKGLSNKIFIVIPTVVGLVLNLLSLNGTFSNFSYYINYGMFLYIFTVPASIIASSALYVALLIFGLKNRIPTILSVSPEEEKKNAEKTTPEQALKILKDKFELGMITEEEYQAQRAEIISKL
jgi:uncharacterized membrane protein